MWSNCIIFALNKLLASGGYIIFTKSKYGWWFHCFWSKDLSVFEEFNPPNKKFRFFPPLLFKGSIKRFRIKGNKL